MRKKKEANRGGLLTSAQVAKKLGFTQDHIRRLCGSGKIKAIKPGHDWLINEQDLKVIAPKKIKEI